MRRLSRPLRALVIVVALALIGVAGVLVVRATGPNHLRIVVLADSLTEGQGEVTDLRRTWPHLVGDQLRVERREAAGSGGTWLPGAVANEMFAFTAGRPGAGSWPATDETGVPGSVARGPVTWDTTRYDSAVVHVQSDFAGARYTARTGDREVVFTHDAAGTAGFVVDGLGDELTVSGDGTVLGVLGRGGTGTVDVYNLARSGSSTDDWLRWADHPALLPLIGSIDPDVVVLSLGGNDLWHGGDPDRFAANLRTLRARVGEVAPRARWVLGTQPVPDQTAAEDWMRFQQRTIDYAAELGAPLIDMVGQMPGYSGAPVLYAADKGHLTDAGHRFTAGVAGPAIRRALV